MNDIIRQIQNREQVLKLPAQMSDQQIAETHSLFELIDSNINWWRGDFYQHVSKIRPTKHANAADQLTLEISVEQNERVQSLMARSSASPRSLHRMACRVSSVLPPSKRKANLPWNYHAVVLEECGVFDVNSTDERKLRGALKLAYRWLDWAANEKADAECDLTLSDLRQIIRETRSVEANPNEKNGTTGSGSPVGDVLRNSQLLLVSMRQVEPNKLDDYTRSEVKRALQPLVDLYNKITFA